MREQPLFRDSFYPICIYLQYSEGKYTGDTHRKLVNIRRVVLEICEWTDKQTHMHTSINIGLLIKVLRTLQGEVRGFVLGVYGT